MKKITDRQKPIIISLKKLQELNNLSAQDIHDMVEQQFPRDCPSISTIKSVFAEGSEEKHFNYDTSLKPILITLFGQLCHCKDIDATDFKDIKVDDMP